MQSHETQYEPAQQPPKPVLYLGAGLIAGGVVIALYIIAQLLSLYTGMTSNPFVADIIRRLNGAVLLADGEHHFILGQGGASIVAVVAFALVAWTGVAIAFGLIRAGAQLISPVIQMQLAGIKFKLEQVKNEIRKNLFSGNQAGNDF